MTGHAGRVQKSIERAAGLRSALPLLLAFCLFVAGCSHRRVRTAAPPPPPPIEQTAPSNHGAAPSHHGKVLATEVGVASWYGAPYHNARGANGQVYDQDAMTAAHRTLPMGTVARVTNLATRQSAVVTITDRGPFVRGRLLDLSRAAALKTGVWRSGTARVRIDVLRYPPNVDPYGRWCVQTGAFQHAGAARKLRDRLQRQYPQANVIDFKGATGYWVRIRPDGASQHAAQQIASRIRPSDSDAYPYLVRLN